MVLGFNFLLSLGYTLLHFGKGGNDVEIQRGVSGMTARTHATIHRSEFSTFNVGAVEVIIN